MSEAAKRIGLLLFSVSAAAWLRMFDQSLSMQYWANLVGKPVQLWLAALVVMPIFEFMYSWPAYLFVVGIHFLICRLKYNDRLNLTQATVLGALTGITGFLFVATLNRDWIMRSTQHNLKVALIYTLVGICYSWAYYLIIAKPKQNQYLQSTPSAESRTLL